VIGCRATAASVDDVKTPFLHALALLVPLLGLAGCQFGPAFRPARASPDMAIVYLYHAQSWYNRPYYYLVHADDREIVYMREGGYLGYVAEPGTTQLWAQGYQGTSSVTLDLEPGKVYYVKVRWSFGFTASQPHLMVVDEALGEKEVRECWGLHSVEP
jgi:hypothetical protein